MSPLGVIHVAFSILGLAAGLGVALARKGTAFHRRLGWTYVLAMVAVNGTALMIYRLLGHFGPFHAGALFSLASVFGGLVPAVRRAPPRGWLPQHAYWFAGSYVGLCAAAVAETFSRTSFLPFWWAVLLASLAVFALGGWVMATQIPRAVGRIRT